jgi:hypothetical protein
MRSSALAWMEIVYHIIGFQAAVSRDRAPLLIFHAQAAMITFFWET